MSKQRGAHSSKYSVNYRQLEIICVRLYEVYGYRWDFKLLEENKSEREARNIYFFQYYVGHNCPIRTTESIAYIAILQGFKSTMLPLLFEMDNGVHILDLQYYIDSIEETSIEISWNPPHIYTQAYLWKYIVHFGKRGQLTSISLNPMRFYVTHVFKDLKPFTEYYFSIVPDFDDDHNDIKAANLEVVTLPSVGQPVKNLQFLTVGYDNAKFEWTAPDEPKHIGRKRLRYRRPEHNYLTWTHRLLTTYQSGPETSRLRAVVVDSVMASKDCSRH